MAERSFPWPRRRLLRDTPSCHRPLVRRSARYRAWSTWVAKPQPPLRLRLALGLLQEHPLPVIDLSRLWFLLRIRLVPLAAPRLPIMRPVLPLPRHALRTCHRITYRTPASYVARSTVLHFCVRQKQASAIKRNMPSTARRLRLANILLLAAPQRTGGWRYGLQHRYDRFTDADLQQRTNYLLELRTFPTIRS